MAFIGDIFKEETLVSIYDLTSGPTGWTSSNLIQFSNIALQLTHTSVSDQPRLCAYQSHDEVNWDCFFDGTVPEGTDSLTIERNNFTGKFVRFEVEDNNGIGTIGVKLIAK